MKTRDDAQACTASLQRQRLTRNCERITNALAASRQGIEHLIDTYTDDTTAVVRLRILVDDITDMLEMLHESTVPGVDVQ